MQNIIKRCLMAVGLCVLLPGCPTKKGKKLQTRLTEAKEEPNKRKQVAYIAGEVAYEKISHFYQFDSSAPEKGWVQASKETPPVYQCAAPLGDGRLLVVAGGGKTNRIYDPKDHTFEVIAPYPTEIHDITAACLEEGKVVVVGGRISSEESLKAVYVYDAAKDSWTTATDYPLVVKRSMVMHLAPGKILVVGGNTQVSNQSKSNAAYIGTLKENKENNIINIEWKSIESYPINITEAAVSSLGTGEVLVVGGKDNNEDYSNSAYILKKSGTDYKWEKTTDYPEEIIRAVAVPFGHKKVLVVGGKRSEEENSNKAYVFDLDTKTWDPIADFPVAIDWAIGFSKEELAS